MDNDMNNYCDGNNYNDDNIHLNLSSPGQKIKYYSCDDNSCIFEILDDDTDSESIDMEYNMNTHDISDDCNTNHDCVNNESIDMKYNMNTHNISDDCSTNHDCVNSESIDMEYNMNMHDTNDDYNINHDCVNSESIDMEYNMNTYDTNDDYNINHNQSNMNTYCNKTNNIPKERYDTSDTSFYNNNSCEPKVRGEIVVVSVLNCGQERQYLEGAKVNIYRLNGLSPVFVESSLTDKSGKAIFNNLPKGCYRVIEIVNKNYFEKPKYIKWNEVTISEDDTNASIIVVNNLKKCNRRNTFR